MTRTLTLCACAALAFAACQPAEREVEKTEPAVAAPASGSGPSVDPLIVEALIASRTPAAMMVDDPCGSGKGPSGASIPWVNAELVKRGHAAESFCPLFADASGADARIAAMSPTALDAAMAMMDDRAVLLRQVSEAQARQIDAIAKGG